MNTTNRVWIELQPPKTLEYGQEQCRLANKMLKRLGLDKEEFWVGVGPGRPTYNITLNDSGQYMECPDNGQWFNLTKLAG
jgi:hypothetical protein